jgi:dihydrofolate synthase/folylpolyglutamate synthase
MMDQFEVTDQMITEGVKNATIKARFEKKYVGDKTFILDVAHNPAAVKTLVDTLEESPMSTVAIFSALIDKDIIDMVNLASKSIQHWHLVPLSSERAIESNDLKSKFSDPSSTTICEDMNSAIQKSLALENIQRVVIFGSFYTIADATLIVDNL